MREIKFRQFLGKNNWHFFEFKNGICEGVAEAALERYPISQYTGLKDKHGKEIYEGDILIDTLTKMKYVVKFGYCKKFAYNGWYVQNDGVDYTTSLNGDYSTNQNSQIEIIGNVYENENLLTQ